MGNVQYENILVLGNGFDMNLGLKTSYADFIKSSFFTELIAENNRLCVYLRDKQGLNNWIDIENEFKRYSRDIFKDNNREIFRLEYVALCEHLCKYLTSLDLDNINRSSYLYRKIICKIVVKNEVGLILNYNYTDVINHILKKDFPQTLSPPNIINIHGSAIDNTIVFGVEDNAQINEEDIFLLKTVNKNYKVYNVTERLKNAETIIFAGHSLGETDHTYFKEFFSQQTFDSEQSKSIFFTYYGEESRLGIYKQMRALTGHRIQALQSYNELSPIDIIAQQDAE